MLKHTFENIILILEPFDDAQVPPIERVLKGRHFFVVGFPRVGTMGMANIIIETYFQEYNMYFRAIGHHPGAPNRNGSRGQALFRS